MKQERRETSNQIERLLEYVYQLYLSSVCASRLIVSSAFLPNALMGDTERDIKDDKVPFR